MKLSGLIVGIIAAIAFVVPVIYGPAQSSTTVLGLNCVGVSTSPYYCEDGNTNSLRNNGSSGNNATVAGALEPADGGGGDFYDLGIASSSTGSAPTCFIIPASAMLTGSGTVGSTTISPSPTGLPNTSYPYLHVGEAVSGGSTVANIQIPQGSEIASIVAPHGSHAGYLTLTLPLTGTVMGSQTISIAVSADNGGTLITDDETPQQCWQKTNYRGDPHEFGAYGDGNTATPHDDTMPLQNWLGAYGNVNPTFNAAITPPNFGPWNMSIPANYMVSAPLFCPENALIQGIATQAIGAAPLVRIFAQRQMNQTGPMFTPQTGSAVLTVGDRCRLSGVAIDASGLQMNGTTHGSTTIDNLTSIANIQVGDLVTAPDISAGTTVAGIGSPYCTSPTFCVLLSAAATGTNSELVSFSGPSAVTVTGSRNTIDDHSLIENGYNNVVCSGFRELGLQIKDAQLSNSGADNVVLRGCSNARVIGNVIDFSNGRGVAFQNFDLTIANNIIEQSAGTGLDLTNAQKVTVDANAFDDNGKGLNGGPAIEIDNTATASICNNHMTGNGEYSSEPAQVHFGGTNDGIVLCGNAYGTELQNGDATWKPSYAYAADGGTVLTNSHLYESPPPQAAGAIYSPTAQSILSPLQVPQIVPNQINGFTLANSVSPTSVLMTPGTAVDGSNSVLIQSVIPCIVDIGSGTGEGHLDTSSILPNTTYFYFALAQAGGAIPPGLNVGCIASASIVPTFKNTTPGLYDLSTTANAYSGDVFITNVRTVAGIRPNDALRANAYISDGTHVTSVGTKTVNTMGTTSGLGTAYIVIANSTDFSAMRDGMTISDGPVDYAPNCTGTPKGVIQGTATTITKMTSNTIKLSVDPGQSVTNDCFNVSGGNVLYLDQPTIGSSTGYTQTVYTGVYRMVGALLTGAGVSPPVIPFTQDGDTFYLGTPAPYSPAISTTATPITIPSTPMGVVVEDFGRCSLTGTSGTYLALLFTPSLTPGAPQTFPTAPGYALRINSLTATPPSTAYPYRLYTDSSAEIYAQANTGAPTLNCMNDGWVLHRSQ